MFTPGLLYSTLSVKIFFPKWLIINPSEGHGNEPLFLSKFASSTLSASELTNTLSIFLGVRVTVRFVTATSLVLSFVFVLGLFNLASLSRSFLSSSAFFLAIAISLLIITVIMPRSFASCFLLLVICAVSSFCLPFNLVTIFSFSSCCFSSTVISLFFSFSAIFFFCLLPDNSFIRCPKSC